MTDEILDSAGERTPLLTAKNIVKTFTVRSKGLRFGGDKKLTAVDSISFQLDAGEVLAVVGESGSGKSTLARVIGQLDPQTSGELLFDGKPVSVRGRGSFRRYCKHVQLIFQDPFASLNPLRSVRYHLKDPLTIHGKTGGDVEKSVRELLETVKLSPAERYIDKYPHELSGGQRQRVSIARALAAEPRLLLADEPVSMLDVSIRLGVLNLMKELKDRANLGILYITHDIASARHFADRVLVMYAGQVVESGSSEELTQRPRHPYTQLLIESAPDPDRVSVTEGADRALSRSAEPPSLIAPPTGCRFHPRCPWATQKCSTDEPPEIAVDDGRMVKCWAYSTETSELPLPVVPDNLAETVS